MTEVRGWLAGRTPPPPAPLTAWVEEAGLKAGPPFEMLLEGGLAELDQARDAPGRVRRSAFHLLAADALLTYACEAALETGAPIEALEEVLRKAAAAHR